MTAIGIIGAGMIANVHAEAANAVGTEVAVVYDPREQKMKTFAEKHTCDVATSVDALLSRGDIQGVIIAVPNDMHAPLAIQALQTGHHVLLEKPMAMCLEQCDEIIAARDASGKVLQLGFVCRYAPAAMKAKEIIDSGRIGDVLHVQATLLRQRGIPGLGSWFTTKARSGGGCLIDIGVHLIDVAIHITSCSAPTCVSGTCNQLFTLDTYAYDEMWSSPNLEGMFDVEDRIRARVLDEQGVSFQFDVSWATHLPEHTLKDGLIIEGSEGALVVDLWSNELVYGYAIDGVPNKETISFPVTDAWDDAFHAEHRAFANAMRNGELDSGAGSGEDGRLVQSIVEAMYASDAARKEITIA